MNLRERVSRYLEETGATKSALSRKVDVNMTTLWKWLDNRIDISEAIQQRLDEFISRFGF